MTEVYIMQYGEWFVVTLRNSVYNHASGTYENVEAPLTAFLDFDDARDLCDTLRKAASGDTIGVKVDY